MMIKMYLIDSFNIIEIEIKNKVNNESIPATLTQLARSATKNLIDKNGENSSQRRSPVGFWVR